MPKYKIYQLKAELEDFEPRIWRRFEVKHNIELTKLSYTVMVMFEMMASHLFNVEVRQGEMYLELLEDLRSIEFSNMSIESKEQIKRIATYYEFTQYEDVIMEDIIPNAKSSNIVNEKLHNILAKEARSFYLNYDFGDNWTVKITLEAIHNEVVISANDLPHIIDGAGYGIIEDVGGVGGLEELVSAFKKKKGKDYKLFKDWLGMNDFDINHFDIDDMNYRIKTIPKIYKKLYETEGYEVTKKDLYLIQREYKNN